MSAFLRLEQATTQLSPASSDCRYMGRVISRDAPGLDGVLLLFDDSLRMPLGSLFAAGGGELSFRAMSSDESVAVVRVIDGELVVEPAYAGDGTTQIEVVATDATGQSTELRFNVRVEFIWPARPSVGWRSTLLTLE